MDASTILADGALVLLALVVFAFARMGWRLWRGTVEIEPGGSYGRQLFGRRRPRR